MKSQSSNEELKFQILSARWCARLVVKQIATPVSCLALRLLRSSPLETGLCQADNPGFFRNKFCSFSVHRTKVCMELLAESAAESADQEFSRQIIPWMCCRRSWSGVPKSVRTFSNNNYCVPCACMHARLASCVASMISLTRSPLDWLTIHAISRACFATVSSFVRIVCRFTAQHSSTLVPRYLGTIGHFFEDTSIR